MNIKKKILLVDDHKIIREGLRLMLEGHGFDILDVNSGPNALHSIGSNRVDLIILDINMPGMNGFEVCKQIKENRFSHKILVFSMNRELNVIRQMLELGVDGYIFKDNGKRELLAGISTIMEGDHFFSSDVATQLTLMHSPEYTNQRNKVQLTSREEEVLKLISAEYTNKEISDQLFISVRTVDSHRRNLIEKIGAKNTAGLVRFAFENNLNA